MPDNLILFHVEGPDGDETARELFDLLRKEFSVRPERMDRETRRRTDPTGGEPSRVTSLIIAIPDDALTAADPDDTAPRTAALERVVAWAGKKEKTAPEERIAVQSPKGAVEPLGRLAVQGFIEAIARRAASGPV